MSQRPTGGGPPSTRVNAIILALQAKYIAQCRPTHSDSKTAATLRAVIESATVDNPTRSAVGLFAMS